MKTFKLPQTRLNNKVKKAIIGATNYKVKGIVNVLGCILIKDKDNKTIGTWQPVRTANGILSHSLIKIW
tara:strand:- start:4069 stop:4275 length:207 start_codon:yes stop_codon:yes gene_type:complete